MKYKTLTAAHRNDPGDISPKVYKSFDYTKEYVRDILDKIDQFLLDQFDEEKRYNSFGFGKYNEDNRKKVVSLRKAIKEYYLMMRVNATPFLSNKEFNNIVSVVTDIIGPTRELKGRSFTQEMPEEYTSNCVSYQSWERYMYAKAPEFSITAKPVEECMGFTYDITVKVDKEKGCKFLYNLSAKIEDICNVDYSIDVKEETCRMEYDFLVQSHPNCTFSYQDYTQYRHDGFTLDLIRELEDLDITTSIDDETGEYVFTTSEGNTYKSSSLLSIEEITNNL